MATIPEILPRFWPNTFWRMENDEYSTLVWYESNTLPKPTEAEIRSHSDEVDAIIAADSLKERQQQALRDTPDAILTAFEILIDALVETRRVVNDIRDTVVGTAHQGNFTTWDSVVVNRAVAMRQKLINIRSNIQ